MYQAQITSPTGKPVRNIARVHQIAQLLGGVKTEAVDAEQGVWLVSIDRFNEARLERDGYLAVSIGGYTVEIEMP